MGIFEYHSNDGLLDKPVYVNSEQFFEEGGYFDLPLQVQRAILFGQKQTDLSAWSGQSSIFLDTAAVQVAATRLGLSVTTLKEICRDNKFNRWPFRKRKSLDALITRTKQALRSSDDAANSHDQAVLEVLEQQRQRKCTNVNNLCREFVHRTVDVKHAAAAAQCRADCNPSPLG